MLFRETTTGTPSSSSRVAQDFEEMDPDHLYKRGSTTFVYHIERKKLYTAKYPTTHEDLMNRNDYEIAKEMGWKPNKPYRGGMYYDNGNPYLGRDAALKIAVLGRVGNFNGAPAIGIWNESVRDDLLRDCLMKLSGEIPEVKAKADEVVVFFDPAVSHYPPEPLTDILPELVSNHPNNPESTAAPAADHKNSPECEKLGTFTVAGKPMKLSTMIGNMHMVKGDRLDAMKGAFCPAAQDVKKKMQQAGCGDAEFIDALWAKFGCVSDMAGQYDQLKKLGAASYRRELQGVFSQPEKIDAEFRGRQKDIDAAWDYLQKGRNEHRFNGFKTWLESKS